MMIIMWNIFILIIALLVMRITRWIYRWSNPKCNGKLPPGSMGFPIIGETREYCKPHGFDGVSPFFKKRMLMYGPLFRTNILGSKTVVSTDPDVNYEILRQENKSFILSYPKAFVKPLGDDNMILKGLDIHKNIKQITQHLLGSEGLKRRMVRDMDRVTREHLESKAIDGRLDVLDAVLSLIVSYIVPKMISNLEPDTQTKLMDSIKAFNFDWFQSLLNLSAWKALYKAFRAHKDGIKVIKDVLMERKMAREKKYEDFLDIMVEELEKDGSLWNQDSAASLIFFISFGAREPTAEATIFAVKFLSENPKVVAELKREHKAILESREDKECGITWEEYRHKMSFTNMVINETLRLMNFLPILFRKAVTDVEIQGYTIPAGWTVLVATQAVHYDPKSYENPFEFNPWRWEGKDVRCGSKTFMAFGGGVRQCVGAEFARLQMAIFIHHLVTYYDFSLVQDCVVIRKPGLHFPKDLSLSISRVDSNLAVSKS